MRRYPRPPLALRQLSTRLSITPARPRSYSSLLVNQTPALTQNLRQTRNGSRFPKRSQTKPAILPQHFPEIMRSKAKAANRFKLPGTGFFPVVSLEHPRLDAGMFFQPLSNRFHRAPSPRFSSTPHADSHVRPKIRQQLQVLRDLGLLEFLGSGSYCLR